MTVDGRDIEHNGPCIIPLVVVVWVLVAKSGER